MALGNAGALQYPLIVRFDHFFEVEIREDARRAIASQGADFGVEQRTSNTQNTVAARQMVAPRGVRTVCRVHTHVKRCGPATKTRSHSCERIFAASP